MSNPSGGIKKWPSRTNCRSPAASRAKAGVRRCSCGNVREALTVVGASNTKRFGGAHQHGEHYFDAPTSPDD